LSTDTISHQATLRYPDFMCQPHKYHFTTVIGSNLR